MSETQLAPTHEARLMDLEERKLSIEERRMEIQRISQRTAPEAAFDLEQRMARTLAASPFLPENVGKDPNERIAAAWGILRYASMLGVDAYALAQQIYVVHGRVGFSAAFLIALVNNRADLREPLDWTSTGSWAKGDLEVTCTAVDKGGIKRSATLTKGQVDAWKWATKPGEPWKADPMLMMRYRTATQLIRLYFGGAVMGLTMSVEELRDIEAPGAVLPSIAGKSTAVRAIADAGRVNPEIPTQREREVIEAASSRVEDERNREADEEEEELRSTRSQRNASKADRDRTNAAGAASNPDDRQGSASDVQRAIDAAPTAGLTRSSLEAHVGRTVSEWSVGDLRALSTLIRETRAALAKPVAAAASNDEDGA